MHANFPSFQKRIGSRGRSWGEGVQEFRSSGVQELQEFRSTPRASAREELRRNCCSGNLAVSEK
jgi:hypothetical protein